MATPTTWLRLPGLLCTSDVFAPVDDLAPLPGTTRDLALEGATMGQAVAALLEVRDTIPGPVGLVGLSLGAIVAMTAAAASPQAFDALIVMSTSARAPRPDQQQSWSEQERLADSDRLAEVASALTPLLFAPDEAARHTDLPLEMARRIGTRTFIDQLGLQRSRIDLRPLLGDVTAPTLVVSGAADLLCGREVHEEIAEGVPGAGWVEIPAAGHLCTVEVPDLVATAISSWLSGPASPFHSEHLQSGALPCPAS